MAGEYDSKKNALLKHLEKQVEASGSKWQDTFDDIERARKLMEGAIPDAVSTPELSRAGLVNADGTPITVEASDAAAGNKKVRANMLLASAEAMLPLIYAKNPDVDIEPSEKVRIRSEQTRVAGGGIPDTPEGRVYRETRQWAETLDIVVSHELRTGGLKKQAKKALRSVQSEKVGWLKVSYQRDYGQDPIVANELRDMQANLARIEQQINDLADGEHGGDDAELRAQELRESIQGLQESPEVMLAEGHVIDHVPTKQMRMDPKVGCLEDYLQAEWIAHYADMHVDDYRARYEVDEQAMKGVKLYREQANGETKEVGTFNLEAPDGDGNKGDVRVWELWRITDNRVFNWADGACDFCREPWTPQGLGERWYPFFLFGFHWISGKEWPESDVDLLERLVQEYNDTREQKNEHRKANIPHYVAAGDQLGQEDIRSFSIAGSREIVVVNSHGRKIGELITPSNSIPMNPSMYDTADTRFDMQWMVGLQDAARGGVVKAKTLGEAEIAEMHLASRAANLRDELEDTLTEMATYVAQNCLQRMSRETVVKIAGENAWWPDIPRQDVFELFDVSIRAGSTGKPDQREDQERWSQMLPHIERLIDKILGMRQARVTPEGAVMPGIPDHLNPYVRMLEETLHRFDERLDIEEFLPPDNEQPPGAGGVEFVGPQPGMGQPGPAQPAPAGGNGGG
ncbi:MAG: hypothetical protein ACOC71_02655, partial [Hyphomicrobiales bacterium]